MAYIETLFNRNFLEYASYVIKDRAIPHIDDGLKPVQRRILHSLFEMDDGKFHKVANVVGHCMKYHPHGDASIASALVYLANKDLLIEKQGNFGNIFTGDAASAVRYIECRLLPFAKQILYNPELTEYLPSYDGRGKEPVTFPAKLPLVLIQGAEGIAVGMSTKILPHNFIEVINAIKLAIEGKKSKLYPDFPTGGIVDASEYKDGLGTVRVRARIDTSDPKKLIIRELPFGSTTESLIASIESAARRGSIKISAINDYTTEKVEIEIVLPRSVYANEVLESLYAFTECEQSISVNLLLIQNGLPRLMAVQEVIQYHAESLQNILRQELKLELDHLLALLHARSLERIFIEEGIYKSIEKMASNEKIFQAIFDGFKPHINTIPKAVLRNKKEALTKENIEMLLKIPIRCISLYDINRARKESAEIIERIRITRDKLKDIPAYAQGFLNDILAKQSGGHSRRSELTKFTPVDLRTAVMRNLSLRYDEKTGFLGTGLYTGNLLFEVSQLDRVLIIKGDCSYSVQPVSEKQFVGRDCLNFIRADKEVLGQYIHSLVYQDKQRNTYLKRFRIEKFIMGKSYNLIAQDEKLLAYTYKEQARIKLIYKPKPRSRKSEDIFKLQDYLVKGSGARGVRLGTREVARVKIQ